MGALAKNSVIRNGGKFIMFKSRCPDCGFSKHIPDKLEGKRAKCGKCGAVFETKMSMETKASRIEVKNKLENNVKSLPEKRVKARNVVSGVGIGCAGVFVLLFIFGIIGQSATQQRRPSCDACGNDSRTLITRLDEDAYIELVARNMLQGCDEAGRVIIQVSERTVKAESLWYCRMCQNVIRR